MKARKVWRYQSGNQNGKSHDGKYNDQQEKLEDIKGVIRAVYHMTGNTMTNKKSLKIPKGLTRNCKSKKDRQYNGQTKKNQKTNNDLQNTSQKTEDRTSRTHTKNWGWTQVIRQNKQFLLPLWHLSCYSCYTNWW